MDKKLLSIIVKSMKDVLKELLNNDAEHGNVKVIDCIESKVLTVMIGVSGNLHGNIVIAINSMETAIKISEVILQENLTEKDTELIQSAVNELGNLIAGRGISMINEIGNQLKITPPSIIEGDDYQYYSMKSDIFLVPIKTNIGEFLLYVSMKEPSEVQFIEFE